MNTTLYRSTVHPPDTQDQQVLQIPAPGELRELALADRLSLRIGVWLLQRAQRPRAERRRTADIGDAIARLERDRTPAEAWALLTYDLQRQLR
ncbi:hypothetical protein [Microbacterium hydrocarbonoxydans]|uniref:hypothetical protein n=1 Tax=Microbacterium hydrocarbonoxydans TaxID=273678 RepID=UPI0007BC4B64|nr:hypothetical protein [Microbacterium hydrocarbonoxydans]GAT72972.1 hypothetical protein MHM582_1452 [Microbacterium sp. HM58-2]